MSLLTPVKVPVKVYRWDDAGAPALDKTPNCMMTIFKACLVTGYGTKESAGWTMPFEDTVAGVKVFRPDPAVSQDYFLQIKNDTGKQAVVSVYKNMIDAQSGELLLRCATEYKYQTVNGKNKWALIASQNALYFFAEAGYSATTNYTASWLFCGELINTITPDRPIYLQHTGGTDNGGSNASMMRILYGSEQRPASGYAYGRLSAANDNVKNAEIESVFDGFKVRTAYDHASAAFIVAANTMYLMPGLLLPSSGAKYENFTQINVFDASSQLDIIAVGNGFTNNTNCYINTGGWYY